MGILDKMNKAFTPKSQMNLQSDVEQLEVQTEVLKAAMPNEMPPQNEVTGVQGNAVPLRESNFDNIDMNVKKIDVAYVRNLIQLARKEVDVIVDPLQLFEQMGFAYPSDLVDFKPIVTVMNDSGCGQSSSEIALHIDQECVIPYNPYLPVGKKWEDDHARLSSPMAVGVVIKAHTSDNFLGNNKLEIFSPGFNASYMMKDRTTVGTLSFLTTMPRFNVNIETENEGAIKVSYSERDGSYVVMPAFAKEHICTIKAVNLWVEVYPVIATSMIRKLFLQHIAEGSCELLPATIANLF